MNTNKYLGIPHKDLGRDWSGVDCWGLVILVYQDYGVDLKSYVDWYQSTIDIESVTKAVKEERQHWVEVNEPAELDVVVLNVPTKHGRFPSHVGIVTSPGTMLHCERGREVCLESYTNHRWQHRIEGFFRYVW